MAVAVTVRELPYACGSGGLLFAREDFSGRAFLRWSRQRISKTRGV